MSMLVCLLDGDVKDQLEILAGDVSMLVCCRETPARDSGWGCVHIIVLP